MYTAYYVYDGAKVLNILFRMKNNCIKITGLDKNTNNRVPKIGT